MADPDPIVTIIVPSYSRPEHLEVCLDSIARTVRNDHEVICVSVAGDDETADVIAAHEAVHLVQTTRGGAVEAMNLGFRAARGVYVMQINDDCELLTHSVANAVRFLEAPAHARIGQAAFFHDSPVRRNVHAEICVEGIRYVVCHVRGLCYANFGMARRVLYERLDYLDPLYFMYGADPDFSLKVWHQAGLEVAPCPGALIHHLELDDERGARERAAQDQDNARLFAKWGLDEGTRVEVSAGAGPRPRV